MLYEHEISRLNDDPEFLGSGERTACCFLREGGLCVMDMKKPPGL